MRRIYLTTIGSRPKPK